MANKFPLILNTSANQIQEIASGDNLDLTGCGINNAGVITATSFSGSGANLTGLDATSIKDSGGNIKIQAQASGAVHTGIATFTGATTFTGAITANGAIDLNADLDVDGHTNLDNLSVAGISTFGDIDVDGHTNLDNVSIAGVTTMSGNITATGTIKTTGNQITIEGNAPFLTFTEGNGNPDYKIIGNGGTLAINDTTNNANRLVVNTDGHVDVTGNLDVGAGIDVTGNVVASGNVSGVDGTFSGNVSIGGTLTYEDVTNIDSVGLITARNGVSVTSGGIKVLAGISNFNANIVGTATTAISITAADESSDTSCNILFATAATGNVAPKTGTNLTFNSSNGTLTATTFSGSGASLTSVNATTLDSLDSSQFLRSDADDTTSGQLTLTSSTTYPLNINSTDDGKINLKGSSNPYIRFKEGTTDKAYIQWHSDGYLKIGNDEDSSQIRIKDTFDFSPDNSTFHTVVHAGNVGSYVGITTEQVTPSSGTATINLAKDDHKIVASGTYTINCTGTGTEANAHTIRVENTGISTVGFSTYFKFPSGGTPSLPTASGAISLISFTVHKTGAVGIATVLLAGASVNFS